MAANKKVKQKPGPGERVVVTNRRARHDYEVLDTVEAGLALLGPEVKSLREGRANMGDAFGVIRNGEAWLEKLHITPYEYANRTAPEAMRPRKLLLHKHEIEKLYSRVVERGLTIVPLRLYFKGGRAKVELGLARGKHNRDKRETIKRRDADLEARRAMSRGGGRERS